MGDKIVLEMRYIHRECVEVEVEDPDKCTILDIFVDVIEGAKEKGMFLPDHPSLWYSYKSESFKLESDNDLLKMFNLYDGKKLIKVAIGSAESSCNSLQLARCLIESKKVVDSTSIPSIQQNKQSIQLQVGSNHETTSLKSHPRHRKIPPTTARRKGLSVLKVGSSSHSTGDGKSFVNQNRPRVVQDELCPDVANLRDADGMPPADSQEELETDSYLSRVDDGYDPDASDVWRADTDAYMDKLYENGELYAENEFGKIILRRWMIFIDKEHFMDVLRDHCVEAGFAVIVVKSDPRRYIATCADADCQWKIHSSKLSDGFTWAIKTLTEMHTCMKLSKYNTMATPEWASTKILEYVRADDDIEGKTVNKLLMKKYGINLKPTSLYKAIRLAKEKIRGDEDVSYEKLPTYCEVLQSVNPGSKAHCVWKVLQDDPEKPIQFRSIFISLKPMIEGFINGCRGLIGVDGCHLKGKYGGVLLSAIALDGNNEIFPIGYGVYENESKATWSSFFYHLRDLLKDINRDNWTIISDRQKGVEPALRDMWPTASRRFCCRHLFSNFKKSYPGKLMHGLFWNCCKAYSEFTFKKALNKLQTHGALGAVKWLQDLGEYECWARHKYDPTLCSPDTTSNFVESFNSKLGVDRCLPVLTLLEGIRRTCMVRHSRRQEEAQTLPLTGITKYAQDKLDMAHQDSRNLEAFKASPTEYEIKDGNSYLPLNITNKTCACGEWQISGIPCRHAIRAIVDFRGRPEEYVSEWYSTEMYRKTYSINYSPVPDEEQWPTNDLPKIKPPTMKRRIGRPTKNRRREQDEKRKGKRSKTVQCAKCKAFGHNSRTCKGGLTARELKELQGIRIEQRQKRKRKAQNDEEQAEDVMN